MYLLVALLFTSEAPEGGEVGCHFWGERAISAEEPPTAMSAEEPPTVIIRMIARVLTMDPAISLWKFDVGAELVAYSQSSLRVILWSVQISASWTEREGKKERKREIIACRSLTKLMIDSVSSPYQWSGIVEYSQAW